MRALNRPDANLIGASVKAVTILALAVGGCWPASHAQESDAPIRQSRVSRETGMVEGVVIFRGEIPKSAVPDDAGVRRELLQIDHESRGLKDVVVWLTIENPSAPGWAPPTNPVPAVVDQRDHEFVPRVLAVHAGQPVRFSNSDPANHNVRTSSSHRTNEFNVFTGIDGSYTHRFAADPQQRPIRLGCDIHPWMRGWIYVFDHPFFAVTDARGRFRIHGVPAGSHTLHLRQPDIRYVAERAVEVKKGAASQVDFEIPAKAQPTPKSEP